MNIRIVYGANIRDYFQIIIRLSSFLFVSPQGAVLKFQRFAIIEPSVHSLFCVVFGEGRQKHVL